MQTFLPWPDFKMSAAVLDNKRLGKQRVEAMQLVNVLQKGSGGWINHPAARMWKYYVPALMRYHDVCIDEWVSRGFNNTMLKYNPKIYAIPLLVGMEEVHASHRSNLLRKDPAHYGQMRWTEPHDLPYVWPEVIV